MLIVQFATFPGAPNCPVSSEVHVFTVPPWALEGFMCDWPTRLRDYLCHGQEAETEPGWWDIQSEGTEVKTSL